MSSPVRATVYVERGDLELALEVQGNISPYVRANFRGDPDTWSPAEGGEVEIESVTLGGVPWDGTLSDAERADAEERLQGALADAFDDAFDDFGDADFDREPYDGGSDDGY